MGRKKRRDRRRPDLRATLRRARLFLGTGDLAPEPEEYVPGLRRRVAELLLVHRGAIAAVTVLIAVSAALGTVTPLLSKVLFDDALFCTEGCPKRDVLATVLTLMVVVTLAVTGLQLVTTYAKHRLGQAVVSRLRNQLYEHLTGLSLGFFTTARTGELQTRVLGDVGSVQHVVTETWPTMLEQLLVIATAVAAMTVLSWPLMLVSLAVLPPFVLVAARAGRVRRRLALTTQLTAAELNVITQETLSVSGALLSKTYGRRDSAVEAFRRQSDRFSSLHVRWEIIARLLGVGMQTAFRLGPLAVYLVAGFLLAGDGGSVTPGVIVAFLALQTRLYGPFQALVDITLQLGTSLVYFQRIFEYLDVEPEIRDRPGAVELPVGSVEGTVRFRDLSFTYSAFTPSAVATETEPASRPAQGQGRYWALDGVDLEIPAGSVAAVVGPSGAGKTTLCYLVARLYDPTSGSVEIDGRDLRDIRISSIPDVVGIVTQETYVFHASARENLAFARPDATEAEIEAAARTALLHERIMEFPDGYDSLLGERGYALSGGERQRLAIARLLLKNPPIVVLDEATSALDTRSERLIQQAMARVTAGRTTIVIAHRLSTVRGADVIFVLDRGRLVERGTHEELVDAGGVYSELYAHQFRGGLVEAMCADGTVLASGEVVR